MTRWMLLALLACASAQDVDRLQHATRALEQAAKASHSPLLAALALKSATTSGDGGLAKVIKFIDAAYNNIQKQIEKETAENTECVTKTAKSDHVLNKLKRELDQAQADHSNAETDQQDAASEAENLSQASHEAQKTRSEKYSAFQKSQLRLGNLKKHDQKTQTQIREAKNQFKGMSNENKDQEKILEDLFRTMESRVEEEIAVIVEDMELEQKEYKAYTEQDDRDQKRFSSDIEYQNSARDQAKQVKGDKFNEINRLNKDNKEQKVLRKHLDAQCVKTTVNVKDRARQRQSEIDSLKQVKEILSQ